MSAIGGKADIVHGPAECPLMTQSGSRRPPQSEALQSDPTNACGGQRNRRADHVEKRDPRGDDNKLRKYGA